MKIPIYQIDAFADKVFKGNPAAVCPLETWLDDEILQSIAQENNLSETAFFVKESEGFHLRWFTPTAEVDLCGHATLATAFVLFYYFKYSQKRIRFQSRSGELTVCRDGELLSMNFPAYEIRPCDPPEYLMNAFSKKPVNVFRTDDYLVVFPSEKVVQNLSPNMELLKQLNLRGVIVTAQGNEVDFVSRFFAPGLGIPEDPVTGSAHCTLVPYWAKQLDKNDLHAKQISPRGGALYCRLEGDRVMIAGKAVPYLEGHIQI